jgi:ADP-glucose pyrophosphorylase
MSDVVIGEGAKIEYAIIDEGTVVGKNAVIGEPKENNKGIAVLSRMINIGDGVEIAGGSIIDKDLSKEENL